MTKIEEFFEKSVSSGTIPERVGCDPFFSTFQELAALNGRLLEIPKESLACCGCDPNNPTKIKTVDIPRSTELSREYAATRQRIEKIHELFRKFDSIAAEYEKLGLDCAPTPYGIARVREDVSNQHLKISRRINNEAAFLLTGRAAQADNVSQHRKIIPMNEQLAGLQSQLKQLESLESKAQKIGV